MSIYLWHCYSAVRATWKLLVEGASKVFSGIFPLFFKTFSSNPYKPNDLESNDTVDATSKTLDCVAYTLHPIFQSDLKIVGIGASGQVYEVDEEIVLKSCRLFKQPGSDASDNDRYHYASDTIFLSGLLQDERLVLRLLQKWPHPHIIEAIDTDQVEGIFLRRYQTLPEGAMTTQPTRIRWYREITDALCHIHKLGIAHADIRIDNILLDSQGSAIICDFSAASPFGQPNLVILDLPLPVNGPSPTLSEATDMFAMGSLIFQVEHGIKPGFSVDTDGELVLPEIHTGHQGIDVIIRNAWLGHYSRTSEMLESLRSLDSQISQGVLDTQNTQTHPVPTAALKERIRRWRENRERNNGKNRPLPEFT
ncbi:uncharacterized protein N7515_009382 [Penicillium bovifimosum]|uniref:Protein kinase domain-containing protein n=1 Tax=Penicillium bovifimosum TaxID=126998 RepID=A0A9W9GJL1_9EURO|nr:uncharacterized protein N7515_009382 [Penicillium bovifimosum]KAJ5121421.1 hypothetical protein N7515_009382 [Penicillium bovifimosum]